MAGYLFQHIWKPNFLPAPCANYDYVATMPQHRSAANMFVRVAQVLQPGQHKTEGPRLGYALTERGVRRLIKDLCWSYWPIQDWKIYINR